MCWGHRAPPIKVFARSSDPGWICEKRTVSAACGLGIFGAFESYVGTRPWNMMH